MIFCFSNNLFVYLNRKLKNTIMKILTFDGRLGKDASVHTASNGSKFISFTVANNSFVGGQKRVDWFDVISYDQHLIETRTKFLTKGTYVIITGTVTTNTKVVNGKVFLNHNVRAINIDTPSIGAKQVDTADEVQSTSSDDIEVSVYTGGTRSDHSDTTHEQMPSYEYRGSETSYGIEDNGDDLPF